MVETAAGATYYILIGAQGNVTGNLVFHFAFSSVISGRPVVEVNPASLSVPYGSNAVFSVVAVGQMPLSYAWQRNSTNMPGATNATYTLANCQASDGGSEFDCVVSNAIGVTNSSTATLNVTAPGELVQNGGFETGFLFQLELEWKYQRHVCQQRCAAHRHLQRVSGARRLDGLSHAKLEHQTGPILFAVVVGCKTPRAKFRPCFPWRGTALR